jgi:hypothetical protein
MEEIESKIISELSLRLEIDLSAKKSMDELKKVLTDHINYLINNDFDKLLRILYRVDVPEAQLKTNLVQQKADAGTVIAEMIFERQLQKIKDRERSIPDSDIPENEKW